MTTLAQPTTEWLDALASGGPVPGGGAAASLGGAIGAALVAMVARFTIGRPKYAAVDAAARQILEAIEGVRAELTRLVDEDADAFAAVSAAYQLPKTDEITRQTREDAIQTALIPATEVPLRIAEIALVVCHLAQAIGEIGNRTVLTDAGAAAIFAQAAQRAALLNVHANLGLLRDPARRHFFAERVTLASKDIDAVVATTLALVAPPTTRSIS